MNTALLVDGNNLLMRAVRTPTQMVAHGVPTGALQIFAQTLIKHVRVERPTRLGVYWDGGRDPLRAALWPAYKAHRQEYPEPEYQDEDETPFALAKTFCALAGVPQFQREHVEADDMIAGAWATLNTLQADQIVILSQDGDFAQLVGDSPKGVPTEWVQLSSSATGTDRWTAASLSAHHGIPGPHVLGMIKALAGDSSDNLGGVRGVGQVKAKKVLAEHDWDLRRVATAKPEWADTIDIMYRLVNLRSIRMSVSAPKWHPVLPGSMGYEELLTFVKRYELHQIEDRLVDGSLWDVDRSTTSIGDLPRRTLFRKMTPDPGS